MPDNIPAAFGQEAARVRASPSPPAASERHHQYGYLTAALRQRGLECTVEYGLSDYIVRAELPDDSSLIISPPQEQPSEQPEGWLVTRHLPAGSAVYEVVYDSEPDGPDARHGGSATDLLAAVDERLDQLGLPPRQAQARSATARALTGRTGPSASGSPRVNAALAPSPSVGQRPVPVHPPTGPPAHTALPPAPPQASRAR
ncbi:hypothetical protein [Streptomyces sp. PTY087I2]|uniref:hypothetical protein n=1 Tax=Streptomyces sp. PTY087I2 TaxID=1819298 RepID=UPI00080BF3DE|nr:hypothetical protein [Streptomyces sp. PTY087I2]OCC11541.1 hypothetical protein A3Q37_02738 [Streptomyces sp. PTY087I2]